MLQPGQAGHRERQGGKEMMNTPIPINEAMQFLDGPEGADFRGLYAEPTDAPTLTEAEEEEMAELWASDRGNQGA
jgi:hypothetical protein